MKRAFDFLVASVLAIATAPVQAIVWIAVRIVDGAPSIFAQQRVGKGGKLFTIHKFRTMRSSSSGEPVAVGHHARVTSLGRILRRTKLDELPQLWDVVRGDMSLVGPRPELEKYVALWDPSKRRAILEFRPGITDPASIMLKDEEELLRQCADPESVYVQHYLPKKVELYEEYVREQSLIGDVRILWQTVMAVASRKKVGDWDVVPDPTPQD